MNRHINVGAVALLLVIFSATCARQESAPPAGSTQLANASRELPIVEAILHDEESPFYLDAKDYPAIARELPVGVFDSGTGGLTVLDAIINFDQFDNEDKTWTAGGDGTPDLKSERFVYLADTANMPYGVCPQKGKTDLLKEHIIKDAWFLLNRKYYRTAAAESPQTDKTPVKAIVIACNTATTYGKSDIEHLLDLAGLDIKVIGVVDAGSRGALGVLAKDEDATIGVMATMATVAAEGYVNAIVAQKETGGSTGTIIVAQQGGYGWSGAIDGMSEYIAPGATAPTELYQGPAVGHDQAPIDESLMDRYAFTWDNHEMLYSGTREKPENLQINSVDNYVRYHTVSLLETIRHMEGAPQLKAVILGCTHFPYNQPELQAKLKELYDYKEDGQYVYRPYMAEEIVLVDPAINTAKELFEHLDRGLLLNQSDMKHSELYISVPNTSNASIRLEAPGAFSYDYKYSRTAGEIQEYVKRVPFSRATIPAEVLDRLAEKLPNVFQLMVDFNQANPKAAFLADDEKISLPEQR
jgi:glutamate racemase